MKQAYNHDRDPAHSHLDEMDLRVRAPDHAWAQAVHDTPHGQAIGLPPHWSIR